MTMWRSSLIARRAALLGGAFLAAAACTEPSIPGAASAPDPMLEAGLVLSDSAPAVGATVEVFARVRSTAQAPVGSFTARIRYDTTALRFDREIAVADAATRISNPTMGLVRFAGTATSGLPDGQLGGYRFVVLQQGGTRTLQLVIDELHTVARVNAATLLRAVPTVTRATP